MLLTRSLQTPPTPRRIHVFVGAVLLVACGFAAGLGGELVGQAHAQAPPGQQAATDDKQDAQNSTPATQRDVQPFPLTYVPDDAVAILAVRPSELLAQQSLHPLSELLGSEANLRRPWGVALEEIEQIVLGLAAVTVSEGASTRIQPALIAAMVRSKNEFALETLKQQIAPGAEVKFYGGQLYFASKEQYRPAFWLADAHTLIVSDSESGLRRAIDARNLSFTRPNDTSAWNRVAKQTAAGFIDVDRLRPRTEAVEGASPSAFGGISPILGPLLNEVHWIVGGITATDELQMEVTFDTRDDGPRTTPPAAQHQGNDADARTARVRKMLDAMLALGRNLVAQNRQMLSQLPDNNQHSMSVAMAAGAVMLENIKSAQSEQEVTLEANLDQTAVAEFVSAFAPAIIEARAAARREESMNNLKQLALAMHFYHDRYGSFPSAAVVGPDGKTCHSWRVALLPFLEQSALYEQYRKNEPWDSEHNKQILAQMPAVYRHPDGQQDSTDAAYFGLVGRKTLFDPSGSRAGFDAAGDGAPEAGDGASRRSRTGMSFRDITDGTSNTLMFVEARRSIPWTKPEDIAYDPAGALPELSNGWTEGGLVIAFVDGTVRFIGDSIDEKTLRRLIERNDHQALGEIPYR